MPRKTKRPRGHRRRVLLLCTRSLLGEGLKAILGEVEDIELIGPLVVEAAVLEWAMANKPDVMLIAEEADEAGSSASLTARLLEQWPDVPAIRVGLKQDTIRLYTSWTLPARRADLIGAIRRLPGLAGRLIGQTASVSPSKS
ncbi:MAG: response regulator transcription factor [Anaerolineales bacterium]|nr:response regulator transcription factor [Anaerolineales bacterium]